MTLKRGIEAVKDSVSKAQSNSSRPATKYEQTNWFYWKAGETKVIRFLTEEQISLFIFGSRTATIT